MHSEESCLRLQQDIDRMNSWVEHWLLEFNSKQLQVDGFWEIK